MKLSNENLDRISLPRGTEVEIEGVERSTLDHSINLLQGIYRAYTSATGEKTLVAGDDFLKRITIIGFYEERYLLKVRIAPKS